MMHPKDLAIGDALLYREGKSIISRLIRWGTNSPYSHALKYLGRKTDILAFLSKETRNSESDDTRHKAYIDLFYEISAIEGEQLVIESDFSLRGWVLSAFGLTPSYRDGVTIRGLSEAMMRSGSHDVFRIRSGQGFGINQEEFTRACLKYAAMRPAYDFAGLLWQAVLAAKFKFLESGPAGLTFQNRKKFWCTEFAHTVDIEARAPADELDPVETNPESYARRKSWEILGNLPYRISCL